jgi:hypothetical protein
VFDRNVKLKVNKKGSKRKMNAVWNEMERQFIREHAGVLTDEDGARKLSVLANRTISKHAWRKQRQKMGIRKSPGRGVCAIARVEVPVPRVRDRRKHPPMVPAVVAGPEEDGRGGRRETD